MAAAMLAVIAKPLLKESPVCGLMLVIGVSSRREPLVPALLGMVVLGEVIWCRLASPARRSVDWAIAGFGLVLCVGVSIDFGVLIVLAVTKMAACSLFGQSAPRLAACVASCAGILLLIGLAHYLGPGLVAASLRAVSWLWSGASHDLPASVAPVWGAAWSWPNALLVLVAAWSWVRAIQFRRVFVEWPVLAVMTALGTACSYYLPFAACVAARVLLPKKRLAVSGGGSATWLSVVAAIVFSAVAVVARWPDLCAVATAAGGTVGGAPARWAVTGRVLLFDLDDSARWRRSDRRGLRLVVTNRWDAAAVPYSEVAQLCRDLAADRWEAYWRTDHAWSEPAELVRKWQVNVLAVPSDRLREIRNLSASRHWRIFAADEFLTYFASADDPSLRAVTSPAGAEMRSLEWPRVRSDARPGTFFVFNSSDRSRLAVARVFNAIRLPNAALRILPARQSAEAALARALCYLESSHQARTHSGQPHLLDQYRGCVLLRQLLSRTLLTNSARRAAAVALAAMEHETGSETPTEPDSEVRRFRSALALGDQHQSAALLERHDGPLRSFAQWLMATTDQTPRESAAKLTSLLETAQAWPKSLLAEAYLSLAKIELECGNGPAATAAIHNSIAADPNSAFRHWRQMLLAMLLRPAD
jgi:hypothetical protein